MTRIFFQGRCVLGWPWEMTSRKSSRKLSILLCWKTRTEAPERRAPKTMEAWLSSSEIIKHPLLTRAGMVVELVAKPIETTMASSLPTKRATSCSNSLWTSLPPASARVLQVTLPRRRVASSTASAQGPEDWAKPTLQWKKKKEKLLSIKIFRHGKNQS